MAFQTLTIAEIIDAIFKRQYVLPAIQREFVWKPDQILKLLDSIMRGYPISTFLFWEMGKEKLSQFKFYGFLEKYHEVDSTHNPEVNMQGVRDGARAVLDGQQRLTALYIALKGSYAARASRQRTQIYPPKKVYLNLLGETPEDSEFKYEFDFLTDVQAVERDEKHHWFALGDILDINETGKITTYLRKNGLGNSDFALDTLLKLYEAIHTKQLINYYLEKNDELDKVLDIFIRINSGGTTLGYSDLLLSIATSQWDNRNAREAIISFQDEINKDLSRKFNFSKDVILKACLVLRDCNIKFSVDNFNKTNMLKIEEQWEDITKAIRGAVKLVASFGFDHNNLTSNYAIIPIAYYLKRIGLPENFETTTAEKVQVNRKKVKQWLVSSLLKQVFGRAADGVLNPLRDIIKGITDDSFPLEQIVERFKGTPRSLHFNEDDLNRLLSLRYNQGGTLLALSLLFPFFDLGHIAHVDHAFPKSKFTRPTLLTKNVPDSKIDVFISMYNNIGNLQLLEGIPNMEKNAMDFDKWLSERIPADKVSAYKEIHLIPDVDLSFSHFDKFLEEREKLMLAKLKKELVLA